MIDDVTLAARFGMAALLGGALGVEREWRGRRAGLRTHILVSLGACLFTVTSVVADDYVDLGRQGVQIDITRIASQIVVGVGFLGGGAILRHGANVKGLTTAANLWVTAAIGLATGFGFFRGAVTVTVISLLCLAGLRPLEQRFLRDRQKKRRELQQSGESAQKETPEGRRPL